MLPFSLTSGISLLKKIVWMSDLTACTWSTCLSCKYLSFLLFKFGEVDRGWRSRGSFPEPGANEEQPVGGEREMRHSLRKKLSSNPNLPHPTASAHRIYIYMSDPWISPSWPVRTLAGQCLPTSHHECTTAEPLQPLSHTARAWKHTLTWITWACLVSTFTTLWLQPRRFLVTLTGEQHQCLKFI